MIISHATVIWRKRNTPVISIHRYLVNKGYVCVCMSVSVSLHMYVCMYVCSANDLSAQHRKGSLTTRPKGKVYVFFFILTISQTPATSEPVNNL